MPRRKLKTQLVGAIIAWYKKNGRKLSFRNTKNPYYILIAEIMLRKTTAQQVDKVFPEFIKRFPTIHSLASADIAEVRAIIKPLGLHGRAEHLVRIARIIVNEKGGKLPVTYEELRKLPGVGDYIAGCVAAFCYGEKVPLIDTNVERVLTRVFGLKDLPASERKRLIREVYLDLVPSNKQREFHYGLLDISAMFCRPRNPKCNSCPLKQFCKDVGNSKDK